MHKKTIEFWQHSHAFNTEKKATEARTLIVIIITFITMIAEITVGWLSNSMALLADGWHMGTHAFALGIALIAYVAARKYAHDARFNFGTWKIEILGAYTSAIVLGLVGIFMIATSIERLRNPLGIHYNEALLVAAIGLIINLICAAILGSANSHSEHNSQHDHGDDRHHEHGHHKHDHRHDHADLNLKSAYLHVVADALTSVLAIGALCGAKFLSANWLDPCMGLVGAGLIIRWSVSLLKSSGKILLDREPLDHLLKPIRDAIESNDNTKICDLHLWRVAADKYSCIVTIIAHNPLPVEEYKSRLSGFKELVHVTIEINNCCN